MSNQLLMWGHKSKQGALLNYIKPTDLPNLQLWLTSDDIVNVSGLASQLTDLSGKNRHATQSDTTKRPTITANALNGHNKLTFDAVNDRLLTPSFALAQPFTLYILDQNVVFGVDKSPFGSAAAPYLALPHNISGVIKLFAGTDVTVETRRLLDLSVYCIVANGASSEYKRNGTTFPVSGNIGSSGITGGASIGGYTNLDGTSANADFYEQILYSGIHDLATKNKMFDYFAHKYATDIIYRRFDDILDNSIVLNSSYPDVLIRNSFGEFSFNTSDTSIKVSGLTNIFGPAPTFAHISVFENDIFTQNIEFSTGSIEEKTIYLSAGSKKVTLVEGGQAFAYGTWLTQVTVKNYTKVTEGAIADKTVFFTDSIGQGGDYATNPQTQAFTRLFKVENSKSVAILGAGSAKLADFASTTPLINTWVARIVSLLSNVTNKKVCIELGTNDFGLTTLASATFITYYTNFIDAIHTALPTAQIYCLSPLIRGNDAVLLDSYRSGMATMCSTRSWSTHIAGKTILSLPADFGADQLHPTIAGEKKLKDAIYPIIYP